MSQNVAVPEISSGEPARSNNGSSVEIVNESVYGEKHTQSQGDALELESSTGTENEGEKITKTRGVSRIEIVKKNMTTVGLCIFAGSIFITAFVQALDGSTTYLYQPYATSSFDRHSMLSTLTIATSVIGAVCKPFIAKISDLTSRPIAYVLVLVLYVIGFIITACSPTIAAYVIGSVFIAIGQSGLDLMNSIIVADMTALKWRSFFTSMLAVPWLVTTWISGYIVQGVVSDNWRWGYGMFAIITPVALTPAILLISWLERRSNKEGEVPPAEDPLFEKKKQMDESQITGIRRTYELTKACLIEIDAVGLLLLGLAFSLILLPCSLYSYANGGWKNPSMIAMEVIGGIFLITYGIYETFFAPFPLLPKRVLTNRTFICCVIIDFIYQFAGYFSLLYFTSYTLAVLNISVRDWAYLSNTVTMGLCFFGVVWGAFFRIFRRYKIFQIIGIGIKLIGMGLYVACSTKEGGPGVGLVAVALVITSLGDAATVMGTQVAAQAAVPHQDMAATMSVLSLYTSIGAGIGSAITAAVWSSKLPTALYKYVPDKEKAVSFFEAVTLIADEPWGSENRLGAIKAYQEVTHTLFCMGVGVSVTIFIVALFQTNYYLGDQHNCVEGEQREDYHHNADGSKKTLLNRVTDIWGKR